MNLAKLKKLLGKLLFVPQGATWSDAVLPFLILAGTAAVCVDSYRTVSLQERHAILIDVAGRQRMLNQKLLHELGDNDVRLSQSTLALLRAGVTELERDKYTGASPEIQEQKTLVEALAVAVNGGETKEVHDLSNRLADNAGRVVSVYVSTMKMRFQQLLWRTLFLTLTLSLLALGLSRLITERRARLFELARANEAAVQASEAKSAFLANMSHEIRTPLNAIIGMADLLENTSLSQDQKRYVESFKRAGDSLLALVTDILDLSKIESGQIQLDFLDFDVHELIERMVQIMALRAHQKGLELACLVTPDVPRFLKGDANRLKEVLMNLLSNAIKFTSTGEVVLRCEVSSTSIAGTELLFSVSDTGIGIPESKFDQVFETFSQADNSISHSYGGSGLGLTICRKLVELMHGRIWLKSQVGVGSTFFFTVKLAASEKQLQSQSQVRDRHAQLLGGKSVLIVDDNKTNRLIIHRYLDTRVDRIEEAASGPDALKKLRAAKANGAPFDMILLDYRMPGMTGLDLMEIVQREELATNTVAMLLTSDGRRSDLGRLEDLGVLQYMIKPIRRQELLEAMERALSHEASPAAPQAQAKLRKDWAGKPRILIADDMEENRFIVSSYLKSSPVEIEEATNGLEALEKHKERPFDLIIMDLRMPKMDGYESIRQIRTWEKRNGRPAAPILALSAQALKEEIEQSLIAGASAHLTKPITMEKLLTSISEFLAVPAPTPETKPEATKAGNGHENGPITIKVEPFLKTRAPEYLVKRRSDIERLPGLIASSDFETIGTLGHNIAGTAGVYGFDELGKLARSLEESADRKSPDDVARLGRQITDYLDRVRLE